MTRRHLPGEPLTESEVATLELIAQGMTYQEIGRALGVQPASVRNRAMSLIAKLGARNATQAVVLGIAQGWLRVTRPKQMRHPVPDWTRIARPQDCRAPRRRTQPQG